MLWDPFLYCISDSIQGNSETGNKVFVLPSKVAINSLMKIFLTVNPIGEICRSIFISILDCLYCVDYPEDHLYIIKFFIPFSKLPETGS